MEKTFDQMNATEKTKHLGFRSYSQREVKEREKAFKDKASDLTIFFLKSLLEQDGVILANTSSDQEKEKFYTVAVNKTYDYALGKDYSLYDLESVVKTLQDLAVYSERMANYAQGEYFKLSYALTGENKFEYVSMRKLEDIRKVASEVFPKAEILEDEVTVDSEAKKEETPTV